MVPQLGKIYLDGMLAGRPPPIRTADRERKVRAPTSRVPGNARAG
jgi:hypothetical protein